MAQCDMNKKLHCSLSISNIKTSLCEAALTWSLQKGSEGTCSYRMCPCGSASLGEGGAQKSPAQLLQPDRDDAKMMEWSSPCAGKGQALLSAAWPWSSENMDQLAAERALVHLSAVQHKTQICCCSDALLYFSFHSAVSTILLHAAGAAFASWAGTECWGVTDCRDLMGAASRLRWVEKMGCGAPQRLLSCTTSAQLNGSETATQSQLLWACSWRRDTPSTTATLSFYINN